MTRRHEPRFSESHSNNWDSRGTVEGKEEDRGREKNQTGGKAGTIVHSCILVTQCLADSKHLITTIIMSTDLNQLPSAFTYCRFLRVRLVGTCIFFQRNCAFKIQRENSLPAEGLRNKHGALSLSFMIPTSPKVILPSEREEERERQRKRQGDTEKAVMRDKISE